MKKSTSATRRASKGYTRRKAPPKNSRSGKLRIGDNWNAITIIALSQNNPLKAIAEFVENSIDARAQNIVVVRGRERGELYLKVIDDGEGIPLNDDGIPDFKYVATHICDSIKKQLKREGVEGIQGEYGIGLLSFWTVGEHLTISSAAANGRTYQMEMEKGESGYNISQRRSLFSHPGTELVVHPLLPGIRQLNGERIQNYLASELRDRIRRSGVKIRIKDRYSRKEYEVKPREFTGRHLADLEVVETGVGDIYLELYLNPQDAGNSVNLFRSGTRVLPAITKLDHFNREPWNAGYLQGTIDVPFLQLTPGTRDGIIHDGRFLYFCKAMEAVEERLKRIIQREKEVEEEKASRSILKSVQRALKEAFLVLPREEFDWFDLYAEGRRRGGKKGKVSLFSGRHEPDAESVPAEVMGQQSESLHPEAAENRAFFEHAGPLYKAIISPASCVVKVGESKLFRCIPRDRERRIVERDLEFQWQIIEGEGELNTADREIISFIAPEEPGLTILEVKVRQGDLECEAKSIVTVTESLIEKAQSGNTDLKKGLPGYTFLRAPGELWRSKYDEKRNLIVINNGHHDYVYAAQKRSRKLKYICRLFAKEMVLKNFPGYSDGELLERMIELGLYTEEYLR